MKKYLYLLLIPLCMGFAACGSDDEELTPTPSPQPENDFGKDGLKGYWIRESMSDFGEGPLTRLFYLDGEGGGFYWWYVAEYETAKKVWGSTDLAGNFIDAQRGAKVTYYCQEGIGPYAVIYALIGSTIQIVTADEKTYMLNKIDGIINGYHRLTKQ